MSSPRMDVLLWAGRICAKRTAEAHVMLEILPDATVEIAQKAFHNIARTAHPDLHRTTCNAQELETITQAFSLVAAAYQHFRTQRMATTRMTPLREPSRPGVTVPPGGTAKGTQPLPGAGAELVPEPPPTLAQQMSSKALPHFRKAEHALKRGDVKTATLHLKMAIASDPQSTFLRSALREVEAEVAKKT